MPRSLPGRLAGAALFASIHGLAGQAPGFRITYDVRVLRGVGDEAQLVAHGTVRGPQDTDLRIALRADTAEVEGLLEVFVEPDTVALSGAFYTRRRAGLSRRGLPLWEADSYRRQVRLPWGGSTRLYPFGSARSRLWFEISVGRDSVGGETRPDEAVAVDDSTTGLVLEAVARPRRASLRLTLVRGDTASGPQVLDVVPDAPARRVTFVLGRGESRAIDVTLTRPDPPRSGRDSALAADADVLCLRVLDPGAQDPARIRCGRLNNVARRLPLGGGDTLVATFAWPAAR